MERVLSNGRVWVTKTSAKKATGAEAKYWVDSPRMGANGRLFLQDDSTPALWPYGGRCRQVDDNSHSDEVAMPTHTPHAAAR